MFVNRNPEYFLLIAKEGSISRAAEKLYISQSSLSQHLAKLERAMETGLVDRSQTPLRLTQAGELYRSYLESNASLYSKFQSDLYDLNHDRGLVLRIGAGNWRCSLLASVFLPDFLKKHPQARLELREFPINSLLGELNDGRADFVLMNTAASGLPESYVNEVIGYEKILLVYNRSTALAEKLRAVEGSPDIHLLEGEHYVALSTGLIIGRHAENFLQENHLNVRPVARTTSNATVLQLFTAGMGFCFMIEAGRSYVEHMPELAIWELDSKDMEIPLSIVYKSNSYLSPLTRELMQEIKNIIRSCFATPNGNTSLT